MKKLIKQQPVDEAKTKINKVIEELTQLVQEIDNKEAQDSTGDIKDKIKDILLPIVEEFEELIAENKYNKSLIKTFTILLTTKCSSINKLKQIIKIRAEIAIKLLPEQKQQ